jgi:deoxycytidine triphosphate deaminase
MEITNNSRYYSIPLVVGRRVAQIVFFDTEGTIESRDYADSGKYQFQKTNLEDLKNSWSPSDMLPKMYMDREIQRE